MMPKRIAGQEALATMNTHLADNDWFAGDEASLADIALYAYTHVADEGGFDLGGYPHVKSWIARIPTLDKFVSMD